MEQAQFELLKIFGAGQAGIDWRSRRHWRQDLDESRARAAQPAGASHAALQPDRRAAAVLFLLAYEPYKRREGELTALVLTIHPLSRFLLEIIRIDEAAVFNTGMSISQNISIGIFSAASACGSICCAGPRTDWPARPLGAAAAG